MCEDLVSKLHQITDLNYIVEKLVHQCAPSFKGNRAFADLRYGEEDSISPCTLICDDIKG